MELNPKIWDNEEMRPEVRKQLLKIVSAFKKSLSIPIDIADVHVVGSNASYNYTDSSDLDVHIIANFSMLTASPEIAKAVYDSAKSDFNKAYDVSVHGIPVELYVEDIRSTVVSNGKYSILTNKWIKKPDAEIVELPDVAEVASIWEEKAKRAIESASLEQVKSVVNNLYLIRKNSIDVDGEYGKGNALFKAIRSSGTMDKLKDTIKELQSKELSLENLREGLLTEESRAQLIQQSKSSKKGLQRYNRRTKSRIATSVQQYNSIDMNKLFKDNTLIVNIQVYGETDNYTVKIRFDGFLDILHRAIDKHNGECNLRVITLALIEAFNKEDVKIHCSCLHPGTLIKLLNGETVTVEDMCARFDSGEKLWVYSVDSNGDFVPGEVERVWETKRATRFIRVTLDNDEQILTTPEHLFLLRDGTYIPAAELTEGQSLMPLYFSSVKGYETVKLNSSGVYHSTYKLVAEALKGDAIEEAKKRVSKDDNMRYPVAIHHKDFNKLNNSPDNLQIMTAREHWDYHSKLVSERFKNDPVFRQKVQETSRKNITRLNEAPTEAMLRTRAQNILKGQQLINDPQRRAQQSEFMKTRWKKVWESMSDEERAEYARSFRERMDSPEIHEKISSSLKAVWENYTEDEYAARCKINAETNKKIKKKLSDAQREYWEQLSPEEYAERCAKNRHPGINKGRKRTEEFKKKHREQRANETEEQRNKRYIAFRDTLMKKILNRMLSDGVEITFETYEEYRVRGSKSLRDCFNSVEEAIEYFGLAKEYNHKVKMVEAVDLPETPVYDIKVKGNNKNFLLAAGVVVHNCDDAKYRFDFWQTKTDINSGDKQEIPSNITNPDNTLGSACKHVLLVLANNSWLLKVASVVNNYIKYMEKNKQGLYADIIYPAIYGKAYEEPVQIDVFADEEEDELAGEEDTDTVSKAIDFGKKRTQFQKGNLQGVRFAKSSTDPNQITISGEDS